MRRAIAKNEIGTLFREPGETEDAYIRRAEKIGAKIDFVETFSVYVYEDGAWRRGPMQWRNRSEGDATEIAVAIKDPFAGVKVVQDNGVKTIVVKTPDVTSR